jgi:thiol-disulfide isomerase/thioredoxin
MAFEKKFSRRVALAALGAVAVMRPVFADDKSPVAIGDLADNKLALAFESAPTELPEVTITGPSGDRPIGDVIKGRTVLMPLWVEWCAPCLIELSDFARLQEVYGKDKFAIVPILTGTQKKFTPEILGTFLKEVNAPGFEPLMEANFGRKLATRMAGTGRSYALPCNLLISPSGKVIGREISLQRADDPADAPNKTNIERLDDAIAGKTQSLWGTKDGDDFATSLANGFVKFP